MQEFSGIGVLIGYNYLDHRHESKAMQYSVALLELVCKDTFELSGVDEASLNVAGDIGETHSVAS